MKRSQLSWFVAAAIGVTAMTGGAAAAGGRHAITEFEAGKAEVSAMPDDSEKRTGLRERWSLRTKRGAMEFSFDAAENLLTDETTIGELEELMLQRLEEKLEESVAEGELSRERADAIIEGLPELSGTLKSAALRRQPSGAEAPEVTKDTTLGQMKAYYAEALRKRLDEAVAEGRITQEQAEAIIEKDEPLRFILREAAESYCRAFFDKGERPGHCSPRRTQRDT